MGSSVGLTEIFNTLDSNHDGAVRQQELLLGGKAFSPPLKHEEAIAVFTELDVNKDKKVDREELVMPVADGHFEHPVTPITTAEFRKRMGATSVYDMFKRLDRDGDNFAVESDFGSPAAGLQPPLGSTDAFLFAASFDSDHDGKVSADEFAGAIDQEHFFTTPGAPNTNIAVEDFKSRMGPTKPDEVIRILDADGDQCISRDEMLAKRKAFSEPLSVKQSNYAFRGMDADHNGKVCLEELIGTLHLGKFFQPLAAVATAAAAATVGKAPTTTTVARQLKIVSFLVRLQGVSFSSLSSDASLQIAFSSICKKTLAAGAGVDASALSLDLSAGSVIINAVVSVPQGAPASAEQVAATTQQGLSNGTVADALIASVKEVPGIAAAVTGSISVTYTEPHVAPMGGRESPSAPAFVSPTISVAEFRAAMGKASPSEAFESLDANVDGRIEAQELRSSRTAFQPPLTEGNVAYVLKGLDLNGDGSVSMDEFIGALNSGQWGAATSPTTTIVTQPPTTTTSVEMFSQILRYDCKYKTEGDWTVSKKNWCCAHEGLGCVEEVEGPITCEKFKKRIGDATYHEVFFTLDENGNGVIEPQEISENKGAFVPPMTEHEARFTYRGFDVDHNWEITPEEFFGALKIGRLWQSETAVVEASRFVTREHEVMTLAALRKSLGPTPVGQAFHKLDFLSDGYLSKDEFAKGGWAFEPPLSRRSALGYFRLLDKDRDGKLSKDEFEALKAVDEEKAETYDCQDGSEVGWSREKKSWCCEHKGVACPHSPVVLTLADFIRRMRASYESPPAAFHALDADRDGDVDEEEFIRGARTFKPPLDAHESGYAFKQFDADRNDKVKARDFYDVIKRGHFGDTAGDPKHDIADLAYEFDFAHDGFAHPPVTVSEFGRRFASAFRSSEDGFRAMDQDDDMFLSKNEFMGGVAALDTSRQSEKRHLTDVHPVSVISLPVPLTMREASYAFQGFDVDRDGRINKREFLGVLRVGKFFITPEELEKRLRAEPHSDSDSPIALLDTTTLPSTTAAPTTTRAQASPPEPPPSEREMRMYKGVPATVSGTAQVHVFEGHHGEAPPSNLEGTVGPLFGEALSDRLGTAVNVAGTECFGAGASGHARGSRTCTILWTTTSPTADGEVFLKRLFSDVEDVEMRIEEHVKQHLRWARHGAVSVWFKVDLHFYGRLGSLPEDKRKFTHEVGRKYKS